MTTAKKISAAEQKRRSNAASSIIGGACTCRIYNRAELASQLEALADDIVAGRVDRVEVDW